MSRHPVRAERAIPDLDDLDDDDMLFGKSPTAAPPPPPTVQLTKKKKKVRDSMYLDPDLVARLHNAVRYFQAEGYSTDKGDIVTAALSDHLSRLEAEHNEGRPFPESTAKLKRGHF